MKPEPLDIEHEDVIEQHPNLALRSPAVAVTLSELAALKGEATAVIEARVQVIETLRRASIRATSPADWVLFKSPDEHGGQITGYLQDGGADRVRDLWGIEIYDVSEPVKVVGNDPEVFHYLIRGSGRCKLTRQVVENMEGGRSSTDDFCRDKVGVERELAVRKAARANLDGGITRELGGMKMVPVEDLRAAWVGTSKQVEQCRLGRGFGTRNQRVGGRDEKAPDVDPPVCPHCNTKGVYRPSKDNRAAFYGCPKYASHPDKKFIVNADEWVKQQTPTATSQAAAQKPARPTAAATPPPTADEVFGNTSREPGSEG